MTETQETDPKGLIREAYRIDNIGPAECRSIFLDWALSIPDDRDIRRALRQLTVQYAEPNPDHPMSAVLRDGLTTVVSPRRRGGWRSRPRN